MIDEQTKLFDVSITNDCKDHWKGMPEYNNVDQPPPFITAKFKFRNEADYQKFKSIVQKHAYNGEKVFDGMQKKEAKQAWYPHLVKGSKFKYVDSVE